MKILSSSEIRKADAYTIANEPVASIDLMERAAAACFEWISSRFDKSVAFKVVCGTGNNGGDGLAIARMLALAEYHVEAFIVRSGDKSAADFSVNEQRLIQLNPQLLKTIHSENDFPPIYKGDVLIDAIFGTGLSKPADGLMASCIRHISESQAAVIAIDIPSGLFADVPTDSGTEIIKANYTLSFQVPKLAFLFAENQLYAGEWVLLDIGLHQKFISDLPSQKFLADRDLVKGMLKPRTKFSHKGMFGHALLIAGSHGKTGAAVLAARACLRSGVGLLTVQVPGGSYAIMQTAVPEAMTATDEHEGIITSNIKTDRFNAIGIGCGIGTEEKTSHVLKQMLSTAKVPLVLDADAINILSLDKKLVSGLPPNTILTPHPKEFERLCGKAKNDFHRHELQIEFAMMYHVYVVLKGAHSCIACPGGDVYFNNTGNAGMAKGGSGDALTGILLSFLAQGYSPKDACITGVYLHGAAGDIASEKMSSQAMLATDLIECLGDAFLRTSNE